MILLRPEWQTLLYRSKGKHPETTLLELCSYRIIEKYERIGEFMNLEYIPKEVFNYVDYLAFMESKKVRHGKERTDTLLDYVTPEQEKELKGNDLSSFDPTPKDIQDHFDFVDRVYAELKEKYPNDEYLNSLGSDFKMQVEFCSTDWYKKYGIEKR